MSEIKSPVNVDEIILILKRATGFGKTRKVSLSQILQM